MNWKTVTTHLYKNIAPIGGKVYSTVNDSYRPGIQFSGLGVEFDMNDFIYEDPFYGEQKSTAPFKMNFDLLEISNQFQIKEIKHLEGLVYKNVRYKRLGAFSNSLDVIPRNLKFGKIAGDQIDFEMSYTLTNSDSYGMMDGTLEEHLKASGNITLPLTIGNLQLNVQKEDGLKKLLSGLNPNIYDLKSVKCTQKPSNASKRSKFEIQYKDIKGKEQKNPFHEDLQSKKWWQFFK